ncbi:PaaI family thioesterase [Marinobacter sp. S6332]|uniref:PaaI family thioesterase n=1 Tax=Marinobacter sp. S6332 TaxID=2926403 RepID=UPI001FF46CA6|nr:PaaI family thioesterase [Marinobacter sp. S6332]
MYHPFADLVGLKIEMQKNGRSTCSIDICEKLLNPHKVVHGAVIYSLADTGMGAALYPSLQEGQICATIEIKINYYRAVYEGQIVCETNVINRGKSVANMESAIFCNGELIAKANGNYSIFSPSNKNI